MKKNTKILCTLGPASNSRKILKKMLKKGMDMARINTAHGNTHEYYSMVRNVRAVGKIPIVIDVKGPEVRLITNKMRNDYDNVKLKNGQTIKVGFSQDDDFFLNHNIYSDIMENDKVFIDNGKIETKVIKKACGYIHLKTNAGGVLKDRRGVNVPKRRLNVRKLSGRDIEAINFAIKNKAEYIALSFTRDKEDILNLKNKLKGTKIKIIAKIENEEGFKNLDSFIGLCDGIMVARGDLGVEMPLEDIPIIQKEIINKCNKKMKMRSEEH